MASSRPSARDFAAWTLKDRFLRSFEASPRPRNHCELLVQAAPGHAIPKKSQELLVQTPPSPDELVLVRLEKPFVIQEDGVGLDIGVLQHFNTPGGTFVNVLRYSFVHHDMHVRYVGMTVKYAYAPRAVHPVCNKQMRNSSNSCCGMPMSWWEINGMELYADAERSEVSIESCSLNLFTKYVPESASDERFCVGCRQGLPLPS